MRPSIRFTLLLVYSFALGTIGWTLAVLHMIDQL